MYRHPIKLLLAGMIAGIVLLILPFFLFKLMFLVLMAAGIYRLVSGRYPRRSRRLPGLHPLLADTIRHMSEEDYRLFRQSLSGDYHYRQTIPITEVK